MIARKIGCASLLLTALALGGCQNSENAGAAAKMSAEAPTPTEMAAYAGRHNYPNTQASDELRIAALVSPDKASIRLYNFGSAPLSNLEIWVNSSYVQHLNGVSPKGSVVIKTTDLYNNLGKSLASQAEPIGRVQIKTDEGFYNVMGPLAQ